MLYSKIIIVCSQIHTNTLCGQKVEFLLLNLVVYAATTSSPSQENKWSTLQRPIRKLLFLYFHVHNEYTCALKGTIPRFPLFKKFMQCN
jgi:hypothetical protein